MSDPGPRGRPTSRDPSKLPAGSQYAGAGLQFALTIVIFVFFGIWLDKRLGTSPWFVLICVFLGAAGGFYSLYRKAPVGSEKRDLGGGGDTR